MDGSHESARVMIRGVGMNSGLPFHLNCNNDQVLAVGQKLLMKLKKTLLLTVQSIEFSDLSTVGGATDGALTQVRWL